MASFVEAADTNSMTGAIYNTNMPIPCLHAVTLPVVEVTY